MRKPIPVCEPLLGGNELKYVADAVSAGWISSSGTYVTQFEEAFAAYSGAKFGVAACNGTVALHLMLVAAGIGKGDEVILPSFTMASSAFAICYTGAKPVFVDARKDTWNIDTDLIESKIGKATKAIMPVHIFGNPCDVDGIAAIAERRGLLVLDDAAEAHGAEYKGRKVGGLADATAFSFFANKNITTGEGGMVLTDDPRLYSRLKYFRNVCFPVDAPRVYRHEDIGFNYRMSNLHAAIGLAQVERADDYRAMRIRNNRRYRERLSGVPGIAFQKDEEDSLNVCWMNSIVIDESRFGADRDRVIARLGAEGVDTRLLFAGMHRQPSLARYGCDCSGEYPVCDWLTDNGFYLPSASSLSEDDIDYVAEKIIECRKG
jgi:perosamine synthetase